MATLSTTERRAINLTWAKPFDGNSPLIRYVLEMSENSKAPRLRPPPRPGRWGTGWEYRRGESARAGFQLPCLLVLCL